jgi:hypothetical protein
MLYMLYNLRYGHILDGLRQLVQIGILGIGDGFVAGRAVCVQLLSVDPLDLAACPFLPSFVLHVLEMHTHLQEALAKVRADHARFLLSYPSLDFLLLSQVIEFLSRYIVGFFFGHAGHVVHPP